MSEINDKSEIKLGDVWMIKETLYLWMWDPSDNHFFNKGELIKVIERKEWNIRVCIFDALKDTVNAERTFTFIDSYYEECVKTLNNANLREYTMIVNNILSP